MPVPAVSRKLPGRPNLAVAIARSGITKRALAESVGVSTFSISRLITGALRPSLALQERIAAVLDEDDVVTLFALDVEAVALTLASGE